ncbi:hypothetical protein AB9P05_05595 [Roseivirga sp. BDSF3-8]|uniref:hypothetical protein n=1 Tax=Roseivirga sp. BDSF3-8 TaxID=3241598 RepID=UPI0035318AC9
MPIRLTTFCMLATFIWLAACTDDLGQPDGDPLLMNGESAVPGDATFYRQLAYRWAPVHHQDTDVTGSHGLSGKGDYITAIDFDGDWNATNNWRNAASGYPLSGHGYYSVTETGTHWFVVYAFFHPRDWTDNWLLYNWDEHENDLEGMLCIIKKDGSTYGDLQGMITVAHSDFFSYVPAGSPLQANGEDIDGTLSMTTYDGVSRPVTAQEAKGHGLKAWPYYKLNGDGIIYYPSTSMAEVPSSADDRFVRYRLTDIFASGGLWSQRFNTACFDSPASSFRKSVGNGSANPPWRWDDGNDGATYAGELATDPANITDIYFKNLGSFDLNYLYNPYIGIY